MSVYTKYPASLDSFVDPSAETLEDAAGYEHDIQHALLNQAVAALQAKVGINESADTNSHDRRITDLEDAGLVTAVNGQSGAVSLTTDDIPEETALFFTNGRARAAISSDSVGLGYSSSTGVLSLKPYSGFSTKTADYTLQAADQGLYLDPTIGNIIVTLPAANTLTEGRIYYFKRNSGGLFTVTLTRSGSDTIDGATSIALLNENSCVGLVVTATGYQVLFSSGMGLKQPYLMLLGPDNNYYKFSVALTPDTGDPQLVYTP